MINENWKLVLINKKLTCFLLFFFMISCAGSIKISKPIPNNDVEYIFDYKIQFVKEAIIEQLSEMQRFHNMELSYPEKQVVLSSSAKKIFSESSNKNDFYLDALNSSIGKSKIYFGRKNHTLNYYAQFHIHLIAIDSTHTKVEIRTIDPKVVVGDKIFPSWPHFGANPKYKSVQSSTIEEYEILLLIGKGVGQTNMPSLMEP